MLFTEKNDLSFRSVSTVEMWLRERTWTEFENARILLARRWGLGRIYNVNKTSVFNRILYNTGCDKNMSTND